MEELGAASQLFLGTDVLDTKMAEDGPTLKENLDIMAGRTAMGLRRAPLTTNLMPFMLLAMTLLPMGIMYDPALGFGALGTALLLSLGFMCLSRALPWRVLAASCLTSAVLGPWMGLYSRAKYLDVYYMYSRSPSYSNIMPSISPGAFTNSAYMSFAEGAYVDITRGLGHQAGERYCVAPIVQNMPMDFVGYWAVGTGCCEQRGMFACGNNLTHATERSGVVVMAGTGSDVDTFRNAVHQAAAVYGIPLPQNNVQPMLLFWNEDFDNFTHRIYQNAVVFCLVALAALLLLVPVYSVTLSLLGLSLFDQLPSDKWHPDQVDLMVIGFDLSFRDYPQTLQRDLLQNRCYYSGEVIYDYLFCMANRHFFLGCFLAHPVHPFSKRERVAVALIIIPLVLFPVAAFSTSFGGTGVLRTLFMLFIVTVPRSLLTLYLRSIATADSVLAFDKSTKEAADNAIFWELGVLAICFAFAVTVAAFCCMAIHSRTTFAIQNVIVDNLDCLGYIFVLDILFDIIWPKELQGRYLLGFFHRWRVERDARELTALKQKHQEEYTVF